MAKVFQHADHQWCQRGRPHAQRLPAHPAGICQRAEHIEDRSDTELAASRTRVAHRWMEGGREAEAHPGDIDAATDAVRVERDVDSQRLEHIGAPASAGGGAISVLGHRDPRSRRDEGGRRGDIECPGAVATSATGIDRAGRELKRSRMRPHRLDEAGHFLDGFALGSQRDQQAGELPRGHFPGHDLVHDVAGLVARKRGPLEQLLDRLRRRHGRGYW